MSTRHSIVATTYDKHGVRISTGTNSYTKTHPLQKHFAEQVREPQRQYLHAEIDALLKAKGRKVHSIVVLRTNAQGEQKLAKPCEVCMAALKAFGVRKISWTTGLIEND